MNEKNLGYKPDVKFLCGYDNIDQARSILATNFYRECHPNDLLFFIDSDHIFKIEDVMSAVNLGGDVSCGIYPNSAGMPTSYMMDPKKFATGEDNRLRFAGTGFMLIRYETLHKVHQYLQETGRPTIGNINGQQIIPFFKQEIVTNEVNQEIKDWLGEDYSFCWLVRQCGLTIRGFTSRTLGHEVLNVRVFYPEPISTPAATQPAATPAIVPNEIVYFCGNSRVQFDPTMNNLGGSEQAVVKLSREFALAGHQVMVYGNVKEGVYDGVHYRHIDSFDLQREYQHLILWRGWGLTILPTVNAKHLYIDLHDSTDPNMLPVELMSKVSRIFVKSKWHRSFWPYIDDSKFKILPNGLQTDILDQTKEMGLARNPYQFCYTSSYVRGLVPLLEITWRIIKEHIPTAELYVCYGDDFIEPAELKQHINSLLNTTPGVVHLGKISLVEVAALKARSTIHIYPCSVPKAETDCLSVRESYYLGCIPLTFKEGVFAERPGAQIPVKCQDYGAYQKIAQAAIQLVQDQQAANSAIYPRGGNVSELSWNKVAGEWLKVMMVATPDVAPPVIAQPSDQTVA